MAEALVKEEEEARPIGLEDLKPALIVKILQYLGPQDLCRLSCTSQKMKKYASSSIVWEPVYIRRFFKWPLVSIAYGVYDYVPEFHYRLANFWKVSYRTFNHVLHVRKAGTGGPDLPPDHTFLNFQDAATAGVRRSERPCVIFLHDGTPSYGEWLLKLVEEKVGIQVHDVPPLRPIIGHVTFMMFLEHDWFHYIHGQFYKTRGGYRVVWLRVAMMKHLGLELRRMLNPNFKEDPIRDEQLGLSYVRQPTIRVRKLPRNKPASEGLPN